ncbi:translation initiation factor IF-1 [Candidatus Nomurabacteria bacterium RIFCSPLOWO2_01_FULL_41_12]|uniref:Translation initiation factor IF-1 n=1 Tax=Candidatus Nomurabacteria bacterium RIFCSPLOWO2_01_FULL_41_12 TaxID=1801774 RepID=A0A1F6WX89_9BACT|nr:MAG: translation initiation factor IF-1 [Candidatus Nomurabacteria bacterium RIFCSPHIGHO2_01_FULL_40_10]OGI86480.1 MAG: translation initiation factor IF-1 [Candidatus Nomurabacteria bacterium RIFCSPLOWO2_01_FULL_41_12]
MSDLKDEKILMARGVVTEALPSTLFRVDIEDKTKDNTEGKKEILAYLSGKMRMHRIKVLIGDSVEIILDPYGGKGRIIKRL